MERSCFNILPQRLREPVLKAFCECDEEIRIALGRPVMLIGNSVRLLDCTADSMDCARLLELICGHSVFAHEDELQECYVTLEDGSRVGMAGKLTAAGMTMPHSFNIRIARQVMGAADEMARYVMGKEKLNSTLLVSPPGVGKTTVLRDMARQLSIGGYRVGIADERGEIAAGVNGMPVLDVGYADVMGGCPKAKGLSLLLRGMSPQVLICDELADAEDAKAVLDASGCGVKVIASAHGGGKDVLKREGINRTVREGAFERILLLQKQQGYRVISDITEEVLCG